MPEVYSTTATKRGHPRLVCRGNYATFLPSSLPPFLSFFPSFSFLPLLSPVRFPRSVISISPHRAVYWNKIACQLMLWDRVSLSLSLSTASLLDYLGRPITKILSGSPFLSVFPFDVPRDTIFPFSSFFFFFICRKRIFDERIIFWKIWRRMNPRLRANVLERVTRLKKKNIGTMLIEPNLYIFKGEYIIICKGDDRWSVFWKWFCIHLEWTIRVHFIKYSKGTIIIYP